MNTAREAILWLLKVQTDYRYQVECIVILNTMYEYW
jgi:hypothetical protein